MSLRIIIIGAGPAGSVAATLLAQAKFHVTLIEQHIFPRDKVCGECLSGLGIASLARSGLLQPLHQLNPARLTRTLLHPAQGPAIELPLSSAMWGLSRRAMDDALLAAARDAGTVIHQPARCEQVISGQHPCVKWRSLETNQLQEMTCDWVLVADGKGIFSATAAAPTGDFGVKTHFENVDGPTDAIELFGVQGHYGGLAPVEGRTWNAAFSIPAARLKSANGDVESMFRQIIRENPVLQGRLAKAARVSPWITSPLPRFGITNHWPEHVIPIGNAAASLEPVGGEGMGLAIRSAELAAEALIAWAGGNELLLSQLPGTFNAMWRFRSLACRAIARIFSNPDIATSAAALLSGNKPLLAALARMTGKR